MNPSILTEIVFGQPSWRVENAETQAFISCTGGHLAPVIFDRHGQRIEPLAIAPWHDEVLDDDTPAMLQVLRGDFFCMPFGANDTIYQGEIHPPHGETSNREWQAVDLDRNGSNTTLKLRMQLEIRHGTVDREVTLIDGHAAVYSHIQISGAEGPMNFGHHAMLKFPDRLGAGVITTSPFLHGQNLPLPLEVPENKGYSIFTAGAKFQQLEQVPITLGGTTDLSSYPARRGYEDAAMLTSAPRPHFAWTAATLSDDGYVWFSLKNPEVLRHTLIWSSNAGRHYPPWSGRHQNVLGLEEITSHFHYGLAESVAAHCEADPKVVMLDSNQPTVIRTIMAVAKISKEFDAVASIEPTDHEDEVELTSRSGIKVRVPLRWKYLHAF